MPDPGRSRQESLLSGFQGSSLRVVRLEKARPIVHSERARGERPNPTHVYWKPSSFRCSLQSTGIWSVSRINFLAAFRVFKNVQKLQGFRIVARHDAGSHMKRPPAGPLFVSSGSACFAAVKVFAYEIRLGNRTGFRHWLFLYATWPAYPHGGSWMMLLARLTIRGNFMTKKKTHVRIDPKRSKPKRKTGKGKSIKKSKR